MVQTSNLLFPGPGNSKMVQTSNLLFPNPGKSKMVQTSNLLFPGRPDFQFAFSRPGKKQNGSDFQFAFFQAGKKQNGSDFHFAFSRPGKKQNGSDFHFAFSRMYQTCSLESKQRLWDSSPQPSAYEFGPYPLGHSSLKNMLFSRLYKRKLDVQFAFPAQTSNLLFPGSYDRVVCALTAVEPTTSPHMPALVGML